MLNHEHLHLIDRITLTIKGQAQTYQPKEIDAAISAAAQAAGQGVHALTEIWFMDGTQQTLADNLRLARGTVSRIIKELEALGVISSSTRIGLEGHHKQYQLMGGFNGWQPMLEE